MIVGVDEAGRGPLAGVVVGCALFLKQKPPAEVRDSKELSATSREKLFCWIVDNSVFSVKTAATEEIDNVNILQATFLTFNRAIEELLRKAPDLQKATFIIDGGLFRTTQDINYRCMEKADQKIKAVSCASIVAKVTRDYLMELADFLCPQWNFTKHKGYPTKKHISLIEKYDLSPFHRKSFAPCKRGRGEYAEL